MYTLLFHLLKTRWAFIDLFSRNSSEISGSVCHKDMHIPTDDSLKFFHNYVAGTAIILFKWKYD